MAKRSFDLNIEEVLENWEVEHAVREVIANALDEQLLTSTRPIDITKDAQGNYHIRDFGRGLRIEHFTLKEDQEKLDSDRPVIGKFGVGLKDALATFHRRGIGVLIRSQFGVFRLIEVSKHGFNDIITLHVEYDDTPQSIVGTDFVLQGATDSQISMAKSLFLIFSIDQIIETTTFGAIIRNGSTSPRVYILGVLANEEPNFLFSYNITNLTEAMRKRLNRERLNVGRTTYTDRIKAILKAATSDEVHEALIRQLGRRAFGDQADEMQWIDVSQHALNLMHQRTKVAYVTEVELQSRPDLIGAAKSDGLEVIVITEQQKQKAEAQVAAGGAELRTLDVYAREFNQSFQYEFIEVKQLNPHERAVFELTPRILQLVGETRSRMPKVLISETMRITASDTEGVWDPSIPAIVVKRPCLSAVSRYAGTLLHEFAHANTGAPDVSRMLEGVLTKYLGLVAEKAIK